MKIFNTVADLQAAKLTADQMVSVKEVGEYRIKASGSGITLANGNIAVPVASGTAVNVLQFGAVGDGVTDDTAAIQAAIDSASNIYFPDGTYLITSNITASKSKLNIYLGQATIVNGGASFCFDLGTSSDTAIHDYISVTGGIFTQQSPTTTSNLNYIRIRGVSGFSIKNSDMSNVSNGGIYVEAGSAKGVIDNCIIRGKTGYTTCRGIWLNGATASDYASQLIDTNTLLRNATPYPVYAVNNVKISNCTIELDAYGIYCMNTRDVSIDNCYIDISGTGANRCIAINNYSPRATITNCHLKSDRSSTGVLVTQAANGVVVANNVFSGDFGGNRAIYVQYLAQAIIENNQFLATGTQLIEVDINGFAIVRGNTFDSPTFLTGTRVIYVAGISDDAVGGSVGSTATELTDSGVVFEHNIVKNWPICVKAVGTNASSGGNEPAPSIIQCNNNHIFNADLFSGGGDYPLNASGGSSGYDMRLSYEGNKVYPFNSQNRNNIVASGDYLYEHKNEAMSVFYVNAAASGGAITVTKIAGPNHALGVSRSANSLILSPRTQNGASGAAVPYIANISNLHASYEVSQFGIVTSGSNFTVNGYDKAGATFTWSSVEATFLVTLGYYQ